MKKRIRFIVFWIFGIEALGSLLAGYNSLGSYGQGRVVRYESMVFFFVYAVINGAAWLCFLRQFAAAKGWGIAASLGNLFFTILPLIKSLSFFWLCFKYYTWPAALIGAVGLLVCSRFEARESDPIDPQAFVR